MCAVGRYDSELPSYFPLIRSHAGTPCGCLASRVRRDHLLHILCDFPLRKLSLSLPRRQYNFCCLFSTFSSTGIFAFRTLCCTSKNLGNDLHLVFGFLFKEKSELLEAVKRSQAKKIKHGLPTFLYYAPKIPPSLPAVSSVDLTSGEAKNITVLLSVLS